MVDGQPAALAHSMLACGNNVAVVSPAGCDGCVRVLSGVTYQFLPASLEPAPPSGRVDA